MSSPFLINTPLKANEDVSKRFLKRFSEAVAQGHALDDPRDSVVCRRWVEIVDGIPDGKLFEIIPATLRILFRDADMREHMEACGLNKRDPMRLQAIAPYVVSFRRFMAARSKPADSSTKSVIAQLRLELRTLKKQFDKVFDQAAEIEAERERLQKENKELQQQVLALRIERDEAQRKISDGRSKAFRFLRLYLFMLKEELQRKKQDPVRLTTVEIAIETNMATLEALGWQDQAERSAREILGVELFEAYFDVDVDGNAVPDFQRAATVIQKPTTTQIFAATAKPADTAPYLPIREFRRIAEPAHQLAAAPAASDCIM